MSDAFQRNAFQGNAFQTGAPPSGGPGTDNLLANDVQSTSELSKPALTQVHALLANDVQSASGVSIPTLRQVHALLANDVQSASSVTIPAMTQVHALLANDVQAASELSKPALVGDPPPSTAAPISPMYSASPEQVERMYRLLFGKPVNKKRKKQATRLEKVALDLMREFDPGPDLPPLDLSSLKQAIELLDKPLETKRQTVEALLTKAIELTREEIDEDDEEVIALFLAM